MGLDRAPIEFQTFYFSHVWLVPPSPHRRDSILLNQLSEYANNILKIEV